MTISFEEFRARLADECTQFLLRGGKIGSGSNDDTGPKCRCPLGSITDCRFPGSASASKAWGITRLEARLFASGFDTTNRLPHLAGARFAALGRAYRDRFVNGVKR